MNLRLALYLFLLLPMVYATYGNGTIYSVGSATISTEGAYGSGIAYTTNSRMDFRPVDLGNGSFFDAHVGLWGLLPLSAPPAPTPAPGTPRVTSISLGTIPWYWFIIVAFVSMGLTLVFVRMGKAVPAGPVLRKEEE